jgi:nucleotide-binding universal stress UspA family protein
VHADKLGKALRIAADIAGLYDAPVRYVGVSSSAPGPLAHTPAEYAAKLEALAAAQSARHGHAASAHPMISHDPTADLEGTLLKAIEQTGADLVVMASHIPGVADRVWPSNGGGIASRSKASVLVVREA